MEFRISDTFVESLGKLNNQEQKAIKTTVFDLQVNPAAPGLSFHKLDRTQDPNFASVRVNDELRLIVHHAPGNLLICFAGHHDDAYRWAARRKLEIHPTTGAAQLVEIRETVQDIIIPRYIAEDRPKPRLFANRSDAELLGYGVPLEWLGDVRAATEDTYLEISDHLPAEAAEALLELAVGGTPLPAPVPAAGVDPFTHPDAQRRFRVMENVEELTQALDYPWEKWTIFLHPEQRRFAAGNYNGPARVSGSAGTGKTVVALHRAVHLAKANPEMRILLATFSDTLANALKAKLRILIQHQPRLGDQIEIYAMNSLGERLYGLNLGKAHIASREVIGALIQDAAEKTPGNPFSAHFVMTEWEQVVDAWQLETWDAYRDVPRLGRKTRLAEPQRRKLWSIFGLLRAKLKEQGLITYAGIFTQLAALYAAGKQPPFDHIVIDEAQDINIPHLKLMAVLGGSKPNGLFFAGDLGQRIFQQPFSWKALGVDVRGRSKTLRINYRTSHQIRIHADKLLGPEITDVDGNTETRKGTVSVFNGPAPVIECFPSEEDEIRAAADWLKERVGKGILPEEIGVFIRSEAQVRRAQAALDQADIPCQVLNQKLETAAGKASLCTMHLAKGLEFRAVAVIACDDEVIPLQERIESATDTSELEEVYNTERHLLYVACTRARDELLVTGVKPGSEFLDDMRCEVE